jgi:hypothetical protein
MALAVERRLRLVRLFIEDPGVHSRWHLQLRGGCGWCGYEDTRIHSRLHFGFRVARGDSRWHLQLRGGRGWCGFEDTRIHSRLHFGFRVARGDSRMMALAVGGLNTFEMSHCRWCALKTLPLHLTPTNPLYSSGERCVRSR